MRWNIRTSYVDACWLCSMSELIDSVADDPCPRDTGDDAKGSEIFVLFLLLVIVATSIQIVGGIGVSHDADVRVFDVLFSGRPVGRSVGIVVSLPGRILDSAVKRRLVWEEISADEYQVINGCFVGSDWIRIGLGSFEETDEPYSQPVKEHCCETTKLW